MSVQQYKHLREEQVRSFLQTGYLRVRGAFTKRQAAEWTADVWTRLGFDAADKSTWTRERTNMPHHRTIKASEFAPAAWAAICDLCGGEERVDPRCDSWNDGFIVNLGSPETEGEVEGVQERGEELDNWHVDGDFFVHFLDSPEQGLLVIPLFTDIVPGGGGTMVCPGGIGEIARWLETHPQGVSPRMVPQGEEAKHQGLGFYKEVVGRCGDFHEMTGTAGDVILMHPLMVHSASRNKLRNVRIITNPPVSLKRPFDFDREDEKAYSLVELKTLKELGTDRLRGWKIQGERLPVIPERLKIQNQWKVEELKRLEAARMQSGQAVTLSA